MVPIYIVNLSEAEPDCGGLMFFSEEGVQSARAVRMMFGLVPTNRQAGVTLGKISRRLLYVAASVFLLATAARTPLHAQTVVSTTSPSPVGEAADASGAVYYVSRSSSNVILKATPSASGYTETTALTSASFASGNLVLDGSDNLYFIANGAVVKETLGSSGAYTESTIAPTGTFTTGLAIDGSGNLYGTTTTGISKLTNSSGTYTASQVVQGLTNPYSVAVDVSGNLYVSILNQNHSTVLKETLSGGTYVESTISSGLLLARGVAVDALGNLYFSDLTHIYKAVPSAGSYTIRLFGLFDGTSGSTPQPLWLALNPSGTALFLEGTISGQAPLLVFSASSVDLASLQFGSLAVGSTASQTLTYTFHSAATLGNYNVTTQGASGLDFSDAGGGTCAAGTAYAANATCTIKVSFSPAHPGGRTGAIVLFDNNGNVIDNATLTGAATGPQLAYIPASITSVIPGTIAFAGIAVDDSGTVYLADLANTRILKEAPSSSGTYTESVVASGLLGPHGVAIDGAGNVFATDNDRNSGSYGLGLALKFTPRADGTYVQTTLASGLNFSAGIGVDASGNVYINDNGPNGNTVIRLAPLPGGAYTSTEIISNTAYGGLAVDPNGIIYIEEVQNGVSRYTPGALGVYVADSFADGNLSTGGSIAADRSGNVYIAGFGAGGTAQVSRVRTNSDGTYSLSNAAGSGIITVDGSGNVYGIGGAYSPTSGSVAGVFRADQVTPPTVTFPPTAVGSTYEFPMAVQFTNIGNVPLTYSVPSTGTNPTVTANFSIDPTFESDPCPAIAAGSNPGTLAPGIQCRSFVNFAPTVSGPITGTFTTIDDNLNVAGAAQVVHLNGTGTGGSGPATVTLVWPTPAPIATGTPLNGIQLNATANVPGTFVYVPPAGTVLTPGSHVLSVTFTPTDTTTYSPATASVQILVTSAAATITWPTPAPIVYGTALSATQLDATANVPGTFVYSPAAGAVLNAGVQTLTTTFTPTDAVTYSTATATVQLVVTQVAPALQWSTPASIAFGTALSATQLNATASVPGTFLYTPAAGAVLPVGEQTLSVLFTPSDNVDYTTATATVPLTVTPSSLDFTFANAGPAYQTVIPGSATSFTFALAPVNSAYPGDVSFSVAGLPAGATYTITPATVGQAAGPQSETLRVQTASLIAGANARGTGGSTVAPLYLSFALLPLCLMPWRRRMKISSQRFFMLLLTGVAAVAGCAALSGCGSHNGFFATAPTNYTVTVTASSGSIDHSATVTLNLQ
jgi:hypothetical protein